MASTDMYNRNDEGYEKNKLATLELSLQRHEADCIRLKAAIEFLKANPGAVALINSI